MIRQFFRTLVWLVLQDLKIVAACSEIVGQAILPAAGFLAGFELNPIWLRLGCSVEQTIVFCRLLLDRPRRRQTTKTDRLPHLFHQTANYF
jgi:hypothetical protein